jgi:hypothetical protein
MWRMTAAADILEFDLSRKAPPISVRILSDTHGRLYDDARHALEGADCILHAGDVGSPLVLQQLSALAPVGAVRGNTDTGEWARDLPRHLLLELGSVRVAVAHREEDALAEFRRAGWVARADRVLVVVSGHTHRAETTWRDGVLFLNPGAAGPARFGLPRSLAVLRVDEGGVVPIVIGLP